MFRDAYMARTCVFGPGMPGLGCVVPTAVVPLMFGLHMAQIVRLFSELSVSLQFKYKVKGASMHLCHRPRVVKLADRPVQLPSAASTQHRTSLLPIVICSDLQ
jgi:hypothetical protein